MMPGTKQRSRPRAVNIDTDVAAHILRELQALRREVSLLMPTEHLADYEHPKAIKAAYTKAIRLYPPSV